MQISNHLSLATIVDTVAGELHIASATDVDALTISNMADLDEAGTDGLSFLVSVKHLNRALSSKAGLILAPRRLKSRLPEKSFLLVDDVWTALIALLPFFYSEQNRQYTVHPTAVIGSNVELGENVGVGAMTVIADNVSVGDNCFIDAQCYLGENVVIESNSILYPDVKLMMDTVVGKNCVIHSGSVLGADGFRFEIIDELPVKIPQVGNVVVGDNVEIGANSCVDRAFLGSTVIGHDTKIDNLVQIGHNCKIGPYNGMVAQVGVAGSVKTGTGVMIWGQAGLADQISIADHTTIGGKSLVMADITEPNSRVFGFPATEHKQYMKMIAALKKLPDLINNMRK